MTATDDVLRLITPEEANIPKETIKTILIGRSGRKGGYLLFSFLGKPCADESDIDWVFCNV